MLPRERHSGRDSDYSDKPWADASNGGDAALGIATRGRASCESTVSLGMPASGPAAAAGVPESPTQMDMGAGVGGPKSLRNSLSAAVSAGATASKALKRLEEAERKLRQDIKFSLR